MFWLRNKKIICFVTDDILHATLHRNNTSIDMVHMGAFDGCDDSDIFNVGSVIFCAYCFHDAYFTDSYQITIIVYLLNWSL